ncbi:hypothetical protein [Clostridioides difficile]|nr:hypothetical protein [Clostridioides difficile]
MFNSIASKKVYEQVIEQIQYKILNGELKKGINYYQKENCLNK